MKATIDTKANTVTLVMPIQPEVSSSGKMTLIASTHGFQPLPLEWEGKTVTASINIGVRR